MKIFPTKNYKIELINNFEKNIQILRLNTLQSDSLSTKLTNKEFIGRINGNHFEIINSKVGIGAYTVLKGDFSNHSVNIVAEVNRMQYAEWTWNFNLYTSNIVIKFNITNKYL